jgi:lambda family phage portal protein
MPNWRSYPLINEDAEPDAFAPRSLPQPQEPESGEPQAFGGYGGGSSIARTYDDGEKFYGGFGPTQLLTLDYWTLRARSTQLFETNSIARGLIKRLVTNEINTGLHLEATPEEKILGYADDELADWAEDVENRYAMWGSDPWLCDHIELRTLGELQAAARMEALIAGDVLVVLRQYQPTGLPRVQLISGAAVQTPLQDPKAGNRIEHGVELDAQGRQIAYWVRQPDGTSKRLPAYGEKSGRRLAWLVYGTERRLDQVRGKPLLSLMLQMMRELERYRDATIRKAVINSLLAMSVEREAGEVQSRGIAAGSVKAGIGQLVQDTADATPRQFRINEFIPGTVVESLNVGEKLKAHPSSGTDEKLGAFEEAVVATIAWTNEVPPEILRMAFSSNYSASKAANTEFEMYLNKVRTLFGTQFCQPIYAEWLLAQSLAGKVAARGFLEAWRSIDKYDVYTAWVSSDWTGQIKPSIDPVKQVNAFGKAIELGLTTRDRASREFNGTKFSKNVQKLQRENEALAKANAPLLPPPPPSAEQATKPSEDKKDDANDEPTNDSAPDEDKKDKEQS